MREKDFIRSVLEEKMPDFEETRRQILQASPIPRRKKGLPIHRLAFAGVSLSLALVLGIYFVNENVFRQNEMAMKSLTAEEGAVETSENMETKKAIPMEAAPRENKKVVESPEMAQESMKDSEQMKSAMKEATPQSTDRQSKEVIIINPLRIREEAKLDVDVEFVELSTMDPELQEIMNLYFSKLRIPQDLDRTVIEKIYTRDEKSNEYTVLHDYWLNYSGEGNHQKRLEIKLSKEFTPLRDTFFGEDYGDMSKIQQTEIKIYGNESRFIAFFQYADANFDVEAHDFSREEFLEVLRSIIVE